MSGKFSVGQEVIMRSHRHRGPAVDESVTITRVGRKYAYIVRYGRELGFHVSDGAEQGEGNYKARIGTAEDFAAMDARAVASKRLDDLTRNYSWHRNLTTDALTQIADIIEAAEVTP